MEMKSVQVLGIDMSNINLKKIISRSLKYLGNTCIFITYAILIFIIITSCITMFDATINPGRMPSVLGYKPMSVLTGSMKPKINPGDLVIVNNITDFNSVKLGSIVTYRNKENIFITHRVTEINNNKDGTKTYVTKGDANPTVDIEPVTQNQLEGTCVALIPYIGYMGMFVKTGTGIISLIVIPMIIIMGLEIKKYLKKRKIESAKSA